MRSIVVCISFLVAFVAGQRITTIQLDGVQYFVSRMNPYSPELNYFLAYQYCRSLGLQLASFETKEKVESMTQYLQNAGYSKYNFWTSGNRLGTGMFLWMSTGLPFNATFDYFEKSTDAAAGLDPLDHNSNTSPQRTARDSSSGIERGCVHLKAPTLRWEPEDCLAVKDFICEQTRCYYYNYGSIPVSSAQGRPITTTSKTPQSASSSYASTTVRVQPTPVPVVHSSTTPTPHHFEQTSPLAALLSGNPLPAEPESEASQESHGSDEDALLDDEEEHDEEEHEIEDEDESEGRAQQDDEPEIAEEPLQHEAAQVLVHHDIPVEQKLKQITREIEEMSHSDRDVDNGRQSFLSLSDLIKNIRPAEKVVPQIDSSYSNTMRVLGETITNGESRSAKI
ncbi:uncharacterized protein LOC129777937 isoform X2 [Toxorhynchites rutilus septentrionalis]|uniref:uncharacterized protein LOC129777937 isoform X2 n=1 Tax=Toxorhynchites rutilus septentrionalis TaxID=329112 RepID=UPI00247A656B|nr:uncharacterized protein LOC129777937 isoform X2 [Toxorhynchites rutilus septentrionalis]